MLEESVGLYDKKQEAQRSLIGLKQRGPLSEYDNRFLTFSLQTDWDNAALA